MAKFAYNNAKNSNIGHTFCERNHGYHSYNFYEKNIDLYLKSKSAKKLCIKLQKIITVYKKNLHNIQ